MTRRSLILGTGITVAAAACGDAEPTSPRRSAPPTAKGGVGGLPPDGRVPRPAGLVRTNWSADPHALGSYSFMKAGATPEDRAALRQPVGDRVFFAGEHVNVDYPSTVHGAMASGRRAADEVLAVATNGERVVVVGAGIAGLSCARALHDASLEVIVLESRHRIGGRLDTVRADGWPIPVERGASWVHDTGASDLDRRLVDAGIAARPWNWDDAMTWDLQTRGGAPLLDDIEEVVDAAVSAADRADDDVSSLAEAIAVQGSASTLNESDLDWYDRVELGTEYGAGADELSARWALREGSEGEDLLVTGGYIGLAEQLVEGFEPRTTATVESVTWTGDGVVVSDAAGQIRAARVVVAVPLGVLQAGTITFDPPLPVANRTAIERLGMGVLDKFWFRFDQPWWRESATIWSLRGPAETPFVEWYNLEPVTGQPVLLSLLGAATAREWSGASDEDVTASALAGLQHFADAGW